MILGLALTLAIASPAPAQRDALIASWTSAQEQTIDAIKDPKRRAAAQRRFASERSELDASPQPAPQTDVVALAKRELATRGRYQLRADAAPLAEKSWLERVMEWLGARWDDFWNAVFGRAHLSTGQSQFFGTTLIAVFLLVLVLVAVRLVANVQIQRRKREAAITGLDTKPGAHVLYARACRSADAGAYGEAAKLLFAATVALLDLRGDVRDRTSATVREMRGQLRSRGEREPVAHFDAIAQPFVASAYAERSVRGDEWEAARTAYAALVPGGAARQ